ncbi:MAG: hypothetical protein FWD90_11430 [Defluviitaleaceae bacterium]|nr:hypothetical protein [Defluviitaleaceae bacterium]
MNMGKKLYVLIIGSCFISVLLGIGFGYLLFGGASVNASIYPGTAVYSTVPAVSGTINEILPAVQSGNDDELPNHRYVVTVVDGYITVFYADHNGGRIKEATTTPANALPAADIERLQEGIRIYTEEALARILQDYGS